MLCNHCAEPSCLRVCPTGATYQRDDGIVLVDYKKCIGCRACITACPYGARSFLDEIRTYVDNKITPYEEVGYQKHHKGVTEKCTFCVERVDRGEKPACVLTCHVGCRHFGDLDNPESEVSLLLRRKHSFQLHPEYGNRPSVYYIP